MSAETPSPPPAPQSAAVALAPRRELFAWAMYDFANSGYTTVVLTAVFNAYFVGVVAADYGGGAATLLWTLATSVTYLLVLLGAPLIGAIADYRADKKRFLAVTTGGCVIFTALLATVQPGDVWWAVALIIVSNLMFAAGENLIAAFLPEIAPPGDAGRISGYGWSLGYVGGLLVLGVCLAYVQWAQGRGLGAEHYVPVTMLITAAAFAMAAAPTFLWLRERARPAAHAAGVNYLRVGFRRLRDTFSHARRYQDLMRFLLTLTVFYCGIYTVVTLAAVYAQEVMGFSTQENIFMILVVNITAAAGALIFGQLQDRIGSVRTLSLTLLIWIAALVLAYFSHERTGFWIAANLIGVALGSSQSAGRALVAQFSPPARSAEFFGLWGLATKLAAVIGPLSYGFMTYATRGDHRSAILLTAAFFVVGLLVLSTVNENRGRQAAHPGG